MNRSCISPRALGGFWMALLLLGSNVALANEPTVKSEAAADFQRRIRPFLQTHCLKCHGEKKQSGDMRLDDLTADASKDAERWSAVRDQLRDGLMPPAREPRPDDAAIRSVVAWVTTTTGTHAARLPNHGNLIPHEALFGKPALQAEAPLARVWRLSPTGYLGFLRDVSRGSPKGIVQPFTLVPERGIKDFAGLYTIDEPTTEILLRNAESIVEAQTGHEIKDGGKVRSKNDSVGEFVALMDPELTPSRKQLESVVQLQYKLAIGCSAEPSEVERFIGLYDRCAKDGDRPAAVKTMLQAVLLRTDAMYRSELGRGKAAADGRRMLDPHELSRALGLTLLDRRDSGLTQAVQKGELTTKEHVAAHVRRMLDDPKLDKPRIIRFFREYFEYPKARDVFKNKPADRIRHLPDVLVKDTEILILNILEADKDVFRELLTTRKSFVNYSTKTNKKTREQDPMPASVIPKNDRDWAGGVDQVYGFEEWPSTQPVALPADTRLGILMQPSWLVAFGTNFDNDPVRRGRWIRERLLGGTVPDLPIGIVAQLPDDPHRTLRDRQTVTRDARCWKCHQRMDDLGLPFENFSHYGSFRKTETVLDPEATEKNVDKKGKSLGKIFREADLNVTGKIADSGEPALDGDVKEPREMVVRLANSDRVRQVFIRHAFRYFLGRNETLADAKTLQDADRDYLASGGSFKALVTSLLTSDAFLYRSLPLTAAAKSPSGDPR